MNSTILNGAVVGKGSLIGAGAVVAENMEIPEGSLVVGVPARVVKQGLSGFKFNADIYVDLREQHKRGDYPVHRGPGAKL
jgi:carbonic anhydrase/acetyltransferase-like protein (isoleucine patch superfamily)